MLFSAKDKDPKPAPAAKLDASLFGQFGNLPKPYKDAARQDLEKSKHLEKLARFQTAPERLLEEAANILAQLNRLKMRAEKRLDLTQALVGQVYPVIATFYEKFHKQESSLPEGNERRNALGGSIKVAEQLAISYKILFHQDYSANPGSFAKHKRELSLYGLRVLEMIRLIQRLKALRYQSLGKTDWLDVNQVFFGMSLHNAVKDKHTLLGVVGVKEKQSKQERSAVPSGSIQDVYISIQLFGLLEINSWPTSLFHVPDSYLELLGPECFQIKGDTRAPLQPGSLVTYLKRDGPPLFQRRDEIGSPSIIFDYKLLYNSLVKDHEIMGKMQFLASFDPSKLSKPLQHLDDGDRLPLLESMLLGLKQRTRQQKRHRVYSPEALRVYFGRKEVMRLLRDLASGDQEHIKKSRQFVDTLAKQSSLLADDDDNYLSSHWSIINFSSGGMLIGTEESAFSTPIKIGQIMAFSPIDAELDRITLGYINRLHRADDNRIEAAIVRLSTYAEAVVYQSDKDMQDKSGHSAILVKDQYNHWQLLVTTGAHIKSGDPLKLIRADGTHLPVRLGDVWLTKKGFSMYELRSPGLE